MLQCKTSKLPAVALFTALLSCFISNGIAQVTENVEVTATVTASCTITPGATIDFGPYNPSETAGKDAAGQLDITCTNGLPATVALGMGQNHVANLGSRAMKLQGSTEDAYLKYELYKDSNRVTPWDSTVIAITGTGNSYPMTIYGRIFANQNTVRAGTYSDTIVATVSF